MKIMGEVGDEENFEFLFLISFYQKPVVCIKPFRHHLALLFISVHTGQFVLISYFTLTQTHTFLYNFKII